MEQVNSAGQRGLRKSHNEQRLGGGQRASNSCRRNILAEEKPTLELYWDLKSILQAKTECSGAKQERDWCQRTGSCV